MTQVSGTLSGIGSTPETTAENVVWTWSALSLLLNTIGSRDSSMVTCPISGPLADFVTLTDATVLISSPRTLTDGFGLLTRLDCLLPTLLVPSMTGPPPEDSTPHADSPTTESRSSRTVTPSLAWLASGVFAETEANGTTLP